MKIRLSDAMVEAALTHGVQQVYDAMESYAGVSALDPNLGAAIANDAVKRSQRNIDKWSKSQREYLKTPEAKKKAEGFKDRAKSLRKTEDAKDAQIRMLSERLARLEAGATPPAPTRPEPKPVTPVFSVPVSPVKAATKMPEVEVEEAFVSDENLDDEPVGFEAPVSDDRESE